MSTESLIISLPEQQGTLQRRLYTALTALAWSRLGAPVVAGHHARGLGRRHRSGLSEVRARRRRARHRRSRLPAARRHALRRCSSPGPATTAGVTAAPNAAAPSRTRRRPRSRTISARARSSATACAACAARCCTSTRTAARSAPSSTRPRAVRYPSPPAVTMNMATIFGRLLCEHPEELAPVE